jgi:hypothetical protein
LPRKSTASSFDTFSSNACLSPKLSDRIVQGTVSIGIGGNKGIGGTNETQFGHEETLRKPTLTVDGYKLIDQGKIQA